MKRRITLRMITVSAVIAAIYVAVALAFEPIMFGPLQFRIPEALAVLPFIAPSTMFGLFIGCLIANIFGGFGLPDIVFGSLATLLAGFLTSKMRNKWLAPVPPILINALVIGLMLAFLYGAEPMAEFPIFALQVGIGQIGACYALGMPLLFAVTKVKPLLNIFQNNNLE